MEFTKQLFTYNDISIEVNISLEDKSIWLSQKDMTILYGYTKSTISRLINAISKEVKISEINKDAFLENSGNKFPFSRGLLQFAKLIIPSENENSRRPTSYYNLHLVLEVGRRLKSPVVSIFEEWCNDILNPQIIEQPSNIIKFDNGMISLDVRVEPDEETVWLTQNQMAILFDTTRPNISIHIANIYEDNELDLNSVSKDFLHTATDGKIYSVTCFNLDMILAVGYRVRSKRAIEFRRWSSSILKKYLTNGYVINKDRITITEQNYINLINDVNDIDYRLTKLEEKISDYHLVDTLIFEDTFFEPKVIINKLIEAAKERIVLIDPYIDINTLDAFKNKNRDVKLMIITFVNRLSDIEINAFIHDYGVLEIVVNDSYHDRYLIIDNSNYYHFGASINYLGKRLSQITKIASQDIIETLNRRIDMYL